MSHSVLICTHNRCQLLSKTLETVAQLKIRPDQHWEVVIVDNASTDATRKVVDVHASTYPVPLRYMYEPRLGHSLGLNAGVRACRGDVIAFTDDDAYPRPDWLGQIDLALRADETDWVFGPVFPRWESGVPAWYDARFGRFLALLDYGNEPFLVTDSRFPFFGVNHACRREALERLGGYREDRGLLACGTGGVGNDIDLFERALSAGMRVVYQPAVAVEHFIPASRCTKRYHRARHWVPTEHYYQFLRTSALSVPWLLGLPRYFYQFAAREVSQYVRSVCRLDSRGVFYHELQLIRLAGLFYRALCAGFKSPSGEDARLDLRPNVAAEQEEARR